MKTISYATGRQNINYIQLPYTWCHRETISYASVFKNINEGRRIIIMYNNNYYYIIIFINFTLFFKFGS